MDCADIFCTLDPACLQLPEDCSNGIDDDGNGLVDCADFICFLDPICQGGSETICNDGLDDDGDGDIDCDDSDCASDPVCGATTYENCLDTVDNNGDGFVDCNDSDCAAYPGCYEDDCGDGSDNDGDGLVDCDDLDCSDWCLEGNCYDAIDNDRDGVYDCADPDCASAAECGELVCTDTVDDDSDGFPDCEDSECFVEPTCQQFGFGNTYTLAVSFEQLTGVWCTGSMDMTLVTDGYNHAEVSGVGTCATQSGILVDFSLDGEAFELNSATVSFTGTVFHTMPNGDQAIGQISQGYLLSYQSDTIELEWSVELPYVGALIPLTGRALYP